MLARSGVLCGVAVCGVVLVAGAAAAEEAARSIELDPALRDKCVAIIRAGMRDTQNFWPAIHAAEAMTQAGFGGEVVEFLAPLLEAETDLQRRCGLAREIVRAGDRSKIAVLLSVLVDKNPHGHVHACESLYKVNEIGDGRLLRLRFEEGDVPSKTTMSAAALARWGNPVALAAVRKLVQDPKGEVSSIAAWVIGRLGDSSDLPALREGAKRSSDPAVKAYFEHALATLGDADGRAALVRNLGSENVAIRISAAEFVPDARVVEGKGALLKSLNDENNDARIRAAQALIQLSKPAPPDRRETIVRDVYVATAANPRYSEGSVIDLRDGRLLYATSEFIQDPSDFGKARVIARESRDEGRTWSEPRTLQENSGKLNVMSASLRRIGEPSAGGPLGLFFCQTNSFRDIVVLMRTSNDEGKSFGEATQVSTVPGYHCVNNDRIVRLSSGRLVCPTATTEDVEKVNHFRSFCFLSEDEGRTWRKGKGDVDYGKRGAMEPEVLELSDGRLLMHFRTQLGHIAVSRSSDAGETWSQPESWGVRSPESPATLRRIPSTGDLLLIWNDGFSEGADHGGKRNPLTAAISSDEGKTWSRKKTLESKPGESYAYTSVLFHRSRAVLTYYVGDDKSGRISSRFRSMPIEDLYRDAP